MRDSKTSIIEYLASETTIFGERGSPVKRTIKVTRRIDRIRKKDRRVKMKRKSTELAMEEWRKVEGLWQ